MSGGDYEEKVKRATTLVRDFPQSTINFLATKYNLKQLEAEIQECCTRESEEYPAILYRARSSSNHSSNTSRPSFSPILPTVNAGAQFQTFPASPPTSAPSEYSPSRGSTSEIVVVFDARLGQQGLSMLKTNVSYNWIRADIVTQRLGLSISPCEGREFVSTPYAGAPNGILHATQQVTITWRKPESDRTEQSIFYMTHNIVNADLIFGEPAFPTPEQMNGSPVPLSPQPRRPNVFAAPPPTGTWGQTTNSYASGPSTITPQNFQNMPHIITGHSGDPNFRHINDWRQQSSASVHSQAPFSAPPPASATPTQQNAPTTEGLLRIKVKWDGSTLPVKLNLNASGETLVTQLQATFTKRALDRNAFQLRLSTSRDFGAVDAEEAVVSFNEGELQEDWSDAVAWTKEQSTPTIYARIESVDNMGVGAPPANDDTSSMGDCSAKFSRYA